MSRKLRWPGTNYLPTALGLAVVNDILKEIGVINIRYTTVDGVRRHTTYQSLKDAQEYAHKWVGPHPEVGRTYAVSDDGIGKIEVLGCTLQELFPMPMENKSEAIKDVLEEMFPGTKQAIKENRCPTCGKPILPFRDELSAREYRISGMCQACQDSVFGASKASNHE